MKETELMNIAYELREKEKKEWLKEHPEDEEFLDPCTPEEMEYEDGFSDGYMDGFVAGYKMALKLHNINEQIE